MHMALYELTDAQRAPIIDGDSAPIATASVTDGDDRSAPYGVGLSATIQDDGAGFLEVVGNSAGTVLFGLKRGGVEVTHTVTVTAAGVEPPPFFDWSLGTPVAK
jgi:hypothetical protein